MRKKKEELVENQIVLDDFQNTGEKLAKLLPVVELSEVIENEEEEKALDDPSKILENPNLPGEVKKDATDIFNEVININVDEMTAAEPVNLGIEAPVGFNLPVQNKMILTYEGDLARKLTNFDREVVDAIATLAQHTKIISASTIFRVISGNQESHVTAMQRNKVDESMEKCGNYKIEIDVTNEFLKLFPQESGNVESMAYSGRLISFEKLKKKAKNGSNIYYKVLSIPPVFRYAEAIGRINVFPLALLNTPIKKTEHIIVVQSYLLREIGRMKKEDDYPHTISWDDVYDVAELEADARQLKSRLRGHVAIMLQFWIEQGFIKEYVSTTKRGDNLIKITL